MAKRKQKPGTWHKGEFTPFAQPRTSDLFIFPSDAAEERHEAQRELYRKLGIGA